jgi:hypothetical protein
LRKRQGIFIMREQSSFEIEATVFRGKEVREK